MTIDVLIIHFYKTALFFVNYSILPSVVACVQSSIMLRS